MAKRRKSSKKTAKRRGKKTAKRRGKKTAKRKTPQYMYSGLGGG